MKNSTRLLTGLLAFGLLTACGGVSEQLGLNRKPIDEFQITTRAPLALPPEYTLRPPMPGAPRPQDEAPRIGAARSLLGVEEQDPAKLTNLSQENLSPGEMQILQLSGGLEANPEIRQILYQERNVVEEGEDEGYLEFLNPFAKSKKDKTVIDPAKEKERLKEGEASAPEETPEEETSPPESVEEPVEENAS